MFVWPSKVHSNSVILILPDGYITTFARLHFDLSLTQHSPLILADVDPAETFGSEDSGLGLGLSPFRCYVSWLAQAAASPVAIMVVVFTGIS